MIRRGSRRFEEESLHASDAAIRPVRQQHEPHRGAVLVEFAVVLPQRTATAVTRVFADLFHRFNERAVLAVRVLAFVSGEVPAGPAVDESIVRRGNADRADAVSLTAVLRGSNRTERQLLKAEPDDADADQRHRTCGCDVEVHSSTRGRSQHLFLAGSCHACRSELQIGESRHRHHHFVDADHHQHVPQ